MIKKQKEYSLDYLFSLVSENKKNKIQKIIQYRTRYITVVLEGIGQPHNSSAVLRSCDIFGIQDVHVVERSRKFTTNNEVSKGAGKWLDIYHHESIESCATALKNDGYTLVAATPHTRGYTLSELPTTKKIALMFGTEVTGLSKRALELTDEFVTIPMCGFTESFNISVSTSICLYELMNTIRHSDTTWQLQPQEKQAVQRAWLERVLHMADTR